MIGTRLLGTIDRIPGIGFVKTKFVHILWIPFFPVASYFIIEGSERPTFAFYGIAFSIGETARVIEMPLNSRSVARGYACGFAEYAAMVMGILIPLLWAGGKATQALMVMIPLEICLILFLIACSKFNIANAERKEEILRWLREKISSTSVEDSTSLNSNVDTPKGL